jgi:predicted transcriptional regulator
MMDPSQMNNELRALAEEANRHKVAIAENELEEFEANAAQWLKVALKKWRSEESNPEEGSQSRD